MNTKWTLPNNIEDSLPPESEILDSLSQSIKVFLKVMAFIYNPTID